MNFIYRIYLLDTLQQGNSCVIKNSRCNYLGREKKCYILREYVSEGMDYQEIQTRLKQDRRRELNSV